MAEAVMVAQHTHRSDVFHTETVFDELYNHLQLSAFPSIGRLFWNRHGRARCVLVKDEGRVGCWGEIDLVVGHVVVAVILDESAGGEVRRSEGEEKAFLGRRGSHKDVVQVAARAPSQTLQVCTK